MTRRFSIPGAIIDQTLEPLATSAALSVRWNTSIRTLQRMRARGEGPPWFVIGRNIFYRTEDVLAFEVAASRKEAP